ncbi:FG-GAP-like repeat-containing protein [Bernardetia sp. ABR2-2B]|uniref:FG-GAP-like repeat-containing protein n=1 Tax=Bernardetia sp. ABR2-2B TaxID=3127472 RepID=UPI0030CD6919
MKKINNKINKKSVSEYCSDYINGFNAHQLTQSWKRNTVKMVAVAGIASATLSANEAKAQFDCPPVFDQIQSRGSVTNPQGLTTTTYRTNPVFVDFDGDGDIDVVSGSGGIPGGDEIRFFENLGTNTSPLWSAPVAAPNGLSGAALFAAFGGSNYAPSFADIDNDGDLDAFIGTFNSGILYQENVGTATAPNYAAAIANPFGATTGAALLIAPTFVDIDGDGDQDMFVGEVFNDIFFFENTGTASAPAFAASTTNQFGLDNTFQTEYLPKLAFADLDNDGDSDAMIGGYYGNFTYFENTGSTTTPAFGTPQQNPFLIQGTGDYRTTTSFADVDGDGDFDLISGTDNPGNYVYFQNYGTPTQPKFFDAPFDIANPLPAGYNATAYADMDGDGDIDLVVGNDNGGGSVFFLENTANSTTGASFAAPVALVSAGGFENHPTLADLDNDGDIDILVGTYGGGNNLHYFENTGTATNFNFGAAQVNPFGLAGGSGQRTPEFIDMDGDGDQDILVGRNVAGTFYYENTGTASAPAYAASISNPFGLGAAAAGASFDEVDLDGDGDLDLAYGDDGAVSFFINVGTSTVPSFVDGGNSFGIDDTSDSDYDVSVVDIDQDGRFEAFVGNKSDELFVYTDKKVIPTLSIVQGASIFSCDVNTLSVSSNVALGDLTVEWYDSNNNLVFTGDTFTLTSLDTETYTAKAKVTATGCVSNEPTVDVIKNTPVISIVEGNSISSCDINTLSVSSTNFALTDLTFTWYDSNNTVVGTGSTLTLPDLEADTYSVKAESPTGCESNQPTINVVKTLPIISVAEGSTVYSCSVNTLSAASSNYSLNDLTFEWRNGNNTVVSTAASFTLTSTATQTYTLTATTVTGCENTTTVNVVENLPVISVAEGTRVNSCETTTLSAASSNFPLNDLTFEWLNSNNAVVGTGQTYNLPSLESQTYRLRATSPTGCQSIARVDVVKTIPSISITEGTSISACEPVTLNVESSNFLLNDLTFAWFDKDNNQVATGLSYEVDPLALPQHGAKEFSVVATSTTGCESNPVDVSVFCSDDVVINLTASAGYNTANLNWVTTGSRPVLQYEVYGDIAQLGSYLLFGYSSTTSYEAIGLLNGQDVDFKVRPVYTDGQYGAYSNVVTVRPSVILGEDDKNKAGFAFFPNPNSGEFNIKLQDGSASAAISVTSISGQRVYTTTLNASQSSINLGNVASGMYIILVETAQGTYQQKISIVR